MRAKLLLAVAVCLTANGVQAATLTVQLRDLTGGTAPGLHSIGIYIKCDAATAVNGFSGAQFDIISQGVGKAAYNGTISLTGSSVLADGYSRINPSAIDATNANEQVSAMLPQPVTGLNDGDIDAVGFSVYNVPGTVDPSSAALGQSGGLEFLAKEVWNFSATDTLQVYLTGAQYFTDQSGDAQHRANYDTVIAAPLTIGFLDVPNGPEPGSVVLMGLGGLGLYFARRKKVC